MSQRIATYGLAIGGLIFILKFAEIVAFGVDATWAQNIEGITFFIGLLVQLVGIGAAGVFLAHRRGLALRILAAVLAVVAWVVWVGTWDEISGEGEIILGDFVLEWPLLPVAATALALAAMVRRAKSPQRATTS